MQKNTFFKPVHREIVKPPYIDLEINTWSKDSHGLFDYQQTTASKFFCQNFKINRSCHIFRNLNNMKTIIQYDIEKKDPPIENLYIATVAMDPSTKIFTIQSADSTGIMPHPYIRQQHPDIFRNSLLVVNDLEKDQGFEGYPLEAGRIVRLGRIEYLVIEVMDRNGIKMIKQTSHLQLNKEVYKAPQDILTGSCKICLCDQATDSDPLISPCACKGSCQLVHAGCLKNWINSKVKKDTNGIAISYNFSKFECQICKTLLPKAVELKGNLEVQMITFEKPTKPYIVLQSVTEKHERRQELKQRNLHVVCPSENSPVRLGRGHQCEIRITDISVSRVHAEIRYDNGKFYIKDLDSKFGTLIKFREQLELRDRIRIQYGRTCFDFLLNLKEKTQKDLVSEEYSKLPVFFTRAQLKERGELPEDDQNE